MYIDPVTPLSWLAGQTNSGESKMLEKLGLGTREIVIKKITKLLSLWVSWEIYGVPGRKWMASGFLTLDFEAQKRKEHPRNYESRESGVLIFVESHLEPSLLLWLLTALISRTGQMSPFNFLETVVFIYVYIISADVYYVGFLHCVSSAALS